MKKDYYNLKELIIGSRSEYLNHQKHMEMLKKLTEVYDGRIKDYYFMIENNKDNKPELRCKIIEDLRNLEEIINYLFSKFNKFDEDNGIFTCLKDSNGDFVIKNKEGLEINVNENNRQKFNSIVEEMLNSDFVKKTNFVTYFDRRNGLCDKVRISDNDIYYEYNDVNFTNPYYYFKVKYDAKEDAIFIECSRKDYVSEYLIADVLNRRVPASILSDYHKEMIDNCEDTKKGFKIDMLDYSTSSNAKLMFDYENEDLILKKVKCKKNNMM